MAADSALTQFSMNIPRAASSGHRDHHSSRPDDVQEYFRQHSAREEEGKGVEVAEGATA